MELFFQGRAAPALQPPLRSQKQLNPCTGDLQLSGPTASFDGQELLCSAGLSSAGKGKRFGGLVQRGEDGKRVALMLEAAGVQDGDPHAGKFIKQRVSGTPTPHQTKPA